MQQSGRHTSVLIAGAGPSGLMMAAQLLRYGVQPVIIDQRDGPTNHTKALAVQARSLEIYRQMGIADTALQQGTPAQGITFNQKNKVTASLSLQQTGQGQTTFPFILMYAQSSNERLLLQQLTQHACPVYWGTKITGIQQHAGGATATLQGPAGEYTLNCDWIVGADGAHSAVRKYCDIAFNGDTYAQEFYLADVTLATDMPPGYLQLYMDKKGLAAFFPIDADGRYRIIGSMPEKKLPENFTPTDIVPSLAQLMGNQPDILQTHWTSTYKIHHRVAGRFRSGCCFLVGDAAHVHSPVGGQGMNTGLQDAYNLAWKLAMVINNKVAAALLSSYEHERLPVAKRLVDTTDRLFGLITGKSWPAVLLKTTILPHLLKWAWKRNGFRDFFFKTVSQTGISYRDSAINLHLSHQNVVRAGDRMPFMPLFDERSQQSTDTHAWCSKPGFTLLVLGKYKEIDIFTLAKWITQKYAGVINLYYLPPSKNNQHVFNYFGIAPQQKKALIIRPDMYIGYINDVVDIQMMDNYFINIMGLTVY